MANANKISLQIGKPSRGSGGTPVAWTWKWSSCLVGGKPTGESLVNTPNPTQEAEERLRGEAIEAESGR